MNRTLLGLPVRWQTSFDWRVIGSRAPRCLRDRVVARAGAYVVGLDAQTGVLSWKHHVADVLDGYVLEVCGDVALTDWRDEVSKRGHLLALDADGNVRWDVELAAGVGTTAVKLDERSLAAAVLGQTWEIVMVDANGGVERLPLPYPGSHVARAPDGSWIVGSSGLAREKPSLFVLSGAAARPVADVAPQVVKVLSVGEQVITAERTGAHHQIVVRGSDLGVRWRTTVTTELVATTPGQLWVVTGEHDHPVPTALDLMTGEVRWRGPALPAPAEVASASGDLVLIAHEEGALLLSASGAVIGEHDGQVGRLEATESAVHLFVDSTLVCLERPCT